MGARKLQAGQVPEAEAADHEADQPQGREHGNGTSADSEHARAPLAAGREDGRFLGRGGRHAWGNVERHGLIVPGNAPA